jgi:hypothetical protein
MLGTATHVISGQRLRKRVRRILTVVVRPVMTSQPCGYDERVGKRGPDRLLTLVTFTISLIWQKCQSCSMNCAGWA